MTIDDDDGVDVSLESEDINACVAIILVYQVSQHDNDPLFHKGNSFNPNNL